MRVLLRARALRWLAAALAGVAVTAPGPAIAVPPDPALLAGLHVPWATPAAYQRPDGSITSVPEAWPRHRVASVRLWDTGTTWGQLEPVDDSWDWSRLDAHLAVAATNGTTDITLVLAGTPTWAASDPTVGAPWLPPGSASPPQDLQEWREYVTAVATRYRGRITAYQIGNEPNLDEFWSGTPEQLRDLAATAIEAIRDADPDALIVAPGPCITSLHTMARTRPWWQALQGLDFDALALQWYPPKGTAPEEVTEVAAAARRLASGLQNLPLWVTEVNHVRPADATARSDRRMVHATIAAARAAGVERMYWYAWSRRTRPELLRLTDRSPAGRALSSYLDPLRDG